MVRLTRRRYAIIIGYLADEQLLGRKPGTARLPQMAVDYVSMNSKDGVKPAEIWTIHSKVDFEN